MQNSGKIPESGAGPPRAALERNWPDLALCDTYTDGEGVERRQLISVCRECHETVCHPERMRKQVKERFVTQERWD